MLGPLLRRKLWRELLANRTKVAVSVIIVALGVSGYFSYTQEARDLESSYQTTYTELGLADHWVELALPTPEAAFQVLAQEPEVTALQPRLHLYGRFAPLPPGTGGAGGGNDGGTPPTAKLAEVLGLPPEPADLNRLRLLQGQPLTANHSSVRAAGELPVVVEHQVVEYHALNVGDAFTLTLPRFDPLAALAGLNLSSTGPNTTLAPHQLAGGLALEAVNLTARVVGVAVSPEYLVVTGSEGILVPRPRSVGVFFVGLEDLQAVVNLTPLPGYQEYGGFVSEAALAAPGLTSLDELLARPGPAELGPLILQTKARSDQPSVQILEQDLEGFQQLTPPLSAIVLAVAGFTIAMNLQRLIAAQRRQIGVLRALGASPGQILAYYGVFAFIIGLAGSLAGLLVGAFQSDYLTTAYAEALGLPEVTLSWNLAIALQGLAFGIGTALLFGLWAARRAAALQPREAMAPPHPERASSLLARLTRGRPLASKLALRNLARNRLRTLLTVGGLGFALVLPLSLGAILASFDSSIEGMFDHPDWSGTALFATPQPQDSALEEMAGLPGISAAVPFVDHVVTGRGEQVPVTGVNYTNLYRLRTHQGDFYFTEPVAGEGPPQAVVIDSLFAARQDLEPGDELTLTLQGTSRTLTVAAVHVEIISHFYVPLPLLQEWWAAADQVGRLANTTLPDRPITGVYLTGDVVALQSGSQLPPYVVEVVEAGELRRQVSDLMDLFTFYVNLFYLVGALMGLLIIANTATLNLLEREEELATLKTLGAPDTLLARVVALENLTLGLMAGLLGVAAGYPLAGWLLAQFTGHIFYVPLYLPLSLPLSFVGLVLILSLLAALPAYLRLRSFDLAGAVRAVQR